MLPGLLATWNEASKNWLAVVDNLAMHAWFRYFVLLLLAAVAAGCEMFDPPLAEIGMKITNGGKDSSCLVQVFNQEGRQLREVAPNELGVVYVTKLVAGTYTFRFVDHSGRPYPAERTVTLQPGVSAHLPVELTQEKDPEGEALASASVRNYGE
jgi:hypothetical protein